MPLTVITGLPGDGVAQRVRDAVIRASAAGRTTVLAVAAPADAARTRAEIAQSAPVGVRVGTLDGLIEAEWALSGDGRRIARGLARDVLLARSLVDAGVTQTPGRGTIGLLGLLVERARSGSGHASMPDGLPGRIVRAVDAYRATLTRHGLIEHSEVCALLACAPPPAEVIAVEGFVKVRPEQESLLCGWSAQGAEVVLSVPWRQECPGTAASAPLVERLKALGAAVEPATVGDGAAPELQRIRDALFTGAPPAEATGAVGLAVASGEEAESRHIASVVAALIKQGESPGSIVIAFADPARHRGWLVRALADEGVEADVELSVSVGATTLGRALLGLHACAAGGLSREDLAALLRTPYSGTAAEQADRVDEAWRRSGPARGRNLLRRVPELDSLIRQTMAIEGRGIGVDEAVKWKNMADQLLVNANPGASPVLPESRAADAAAHRALCRQLQEALELGAGEVTADELWARFASTRVEVPSVRHAGRVLVVGLDAVSTGDFMHVVVGGLTAMEIPRRGSEDRLEGDSVRRAMAALGIVITPGDHALEERRAFYLAATTARSTLTLTRQESNDEGTPLRESVFWDEFLDLYRAPGDALPTSGPLVRRAVTAEANVACGSARRQRGSLLAPASIEALSSITEVSPSQVETYLSCPYRWFIERRIGAEPLDRTLDRSAAGRLAHDALARFYREWLTHSPRVTPDTRQVAGAAAAEAVRSATRDEHVPETLEELAMMEAVGPSVVALVERDAEFLPSCAPRHIEWAFGGTSEVPAVDIGGVALKGRADRIDVGPSGLVVVDYKRTTSSSLSQIRRGGLVQLQLYAVAASRALGLPVAGGLYRSLKDGSDRGFALSGVSDDLKAADVVAQDGLDALLSEAVEAARTAAAAMREGRIDPTPSPDACRYCAAAGYCPEAVTA